MYYWIYIFYYIYVLDCKPFVFGIIHLLSSKIMGSSPRDIYALLIRHTHYLAYVFDPIFNLHYKLIIPF